MVTLEDAEWVRLIDGQREDSALPTCCANTSELRDCIISLLRYGCHLDSFHRLWFRDAFAGFSEGHDLPADGILRKLAAQIPEG